MDAISVRCKSCKRVMKFSADKAGKKVKCKCGNVVMVQPPQDKAPKTAEEADEAAELLLAEDPEPVVAQVEETAPPEEAQFKQEEEAETLQLVEEPQTKTKGKSKKKAKVQEPSTAVQTQ